MTSPHARWTVSSSGRALALIATLAFLSVPVVLDPASIREAAALHELGRSSTPYWQPSHALLLYVRVPAAVVSAGIFVLSPGLLMTAALGMGRSLGKWLLSGFAVSLVLVSAVAALLQAIRGETVAGTPFVAVVAGLALAGAAGLIVRSRVSDWSVPIPGPGLGPATIAMILAPYALVAALVPKFFWESFNGDGVHAFESTRLLLHQAVPFWPPESGAIAGFPGITSMLFTWPGSWFLRLFGPLEAAARVSLILFLTLLVAVIGEFVSLREPRSRVPTLAIWCTLGGYVLTLAFSASYNPYSADLALPATQDTLLLACFLAYVLSFLRHERGWTACWAMLTYVALPSGLILVAFWLAASVFVIRPRPWARVRLTAGAVLAAMVIGVVLTRLLPVVGLPAPGNEYGLAGILRYFAFLQATDLRRLLYVSVPCGVLPLLSTFWWRKQDEGLRALTLVTWAYFAFFYVQGFVALHHFVPAMVLPIVVFWGLVATHPRRSRALAGASAVVGLLLTAPSSWRPQLDGRAIGVTVVERIGGYERSSPDEFRASTLLASLFPYDWDPSVPASSYGGSPLVWNYYAHHDGELADGVNYLLAPIADPGPAGWEPVSRDSAAVLFVRDQAVWARQRALRPPTDASAPLLRVPRWVLFRSVPREGGPAMLDVVSAIERTGIDLEPLLRRLGVRR